MIAWLSGVLRARSDDGDLIVDVGGVGYAVRVPVGVAGQISLGEPLELHIYTQVREDQLALFGFEEQSQLAAFNALIGVSKVGPKLAINVLSGISPASLVAAVDSGDMATLTSVSGVGKRLAERLAVELRGKLDGVGPAASGTARLPVGSAANRTFGDLKSALANLQYRPKEIDAVLSQLAQQDADQPFDALLRSALGMLRR